VKSLFISYRRDDSAGHAGRLQDGLTERFGHGRVFMDVSDLKPGQRSKPHTVAAKPATSNSEPAPPRAVSTGTTAASITVATAQRFAITIPTVSEVRFRTHRARLSFSILAIRLEPRDGATQVLSVLVRMHNHGPLDEAFNSDQFRLVAGEQVIAPTLSFHTSTEPVAARETRLDFVVPAGVMEPALEVRVNTENTRLPMPLSARSLIANDGSLDAFGQPRRVRVVDAIKALPATLVAGQRVEVGKQSYQIVEATIERETVEKASLTLTVRCSVPRDAGGVNFWSNTVRLWIDGVPRAPVNNVNEIIGPGDSKDARFEFDLLALPRTLEVGIVSSNDSAKIALSLDSVLKR
jgi:hypothetical protein